MLRRQDHGHGDVDVLGGVGDVCGEGDVHGEGVPLRVFLEVDDGVVDGGEGGVDDLGAADGEDGAGGAVGGCGEGDGGDSWALEGGV